MLFTDGSENRGPSALESRRSALLDDPVSSDTKLPFKQLSLLDKTEISYR